MSTETFTKVTCNLCGLTCTDMNRVNAKWVTIEIDDPITGEDYRKDICVSCLNLIRAEIEVIEHVANITPDMINRAKEIE